MAKSDIFDLLHPVSRKLGIGKSLKQTTEVKQRSYYGHFRTGCRRQNMTRTWTAKSRGYLRYQSGAEKDRGGKPSKEKSNKKET